MDPTNRKDANDIYSELEKYAKKTCAYFNKKYAGNIFCFEIRFFIVDDYAVLIPKITLHKVVSCNRIDIPKVMTEAFDNYIKQIPSKMEINKKIFKVYILNSLSLSNENFIELLCNANSITIPSSTGKDLNILDDKMYKDFVKWIRENMTWWFRLDDDPPLMSIDYDYPIYEYIIKVLHYI